MLDDVARTAVRESIVKPDEVTGGKLCCEIVAAWGAGDTTRYGNRIPVAGAEVRGVVARRGIWVLLLRIARGLQSTTVWASDCARGVGAVADGAVFLDINHVVVHVDPKEGAAGGERHDTSLKNLLALGAASND